jgi:hypothetical protein
LQDSKSFATGLDSATATAYIGWDDFSGSRRFSGLIDDVRVYNRVLDAAAITALYNSGSGCQ